MKTQHDKEYFITLIREIYPEDIKKLSDEEKNRKIKLVRESNDQFGINSPFEILDFYNDIEFRQIRKSRIGEVLHKKFLQEEFECLPFFFPELEGMLLTDSEISTAKKQENTKALINWAELSRHITGNETYISRTRCPKKYQPKVDALLSKIEEWEKENCR